MAEARNWTPAQSQMQNSMPRRLRIKTQIVAAYNLLPSSQKIVAFRTSFKTMPLRLSLGGQPSGPCRNNLAERDLRPTGHPERSVWLRLGRSTNTHSILMSILYSLKKQKGNVEYHLKQVLDQLAKDPHQDPFSLLFAKNTHAPLINPPGTSPFTLNTRL